MVLRIARIGNGVTDLDLARPFYQALGFAAGEPFDLGTALSPQAELPGSPLVIQVVRRDGFDLELVQHGGARAAARPPSRRPMNQLGLTHLALAVDDVDRVADLVERYGGTICDYTRAKLDGTTALFCLDPCGTRLLLAGPGSSAVSRAEPGDDGISIDVPTMHEPHGWIFVLDPNGVQIEIVAPRA